MVNCQGLVRTSPPKFGSQELCRYCRTQVCEECYVQATNPTLEWQLSKHDHLHHTCISCIRLRPESNELHLSPRKSRQQRHSSQTQERTGLLKTDVRRRRRHTSETPPTLWSVDLAKPSLTPSRIRQLQRNNKAIKPQAAKRHDNAMELHAIRKDVPTSYSCGSTRMSPVMTNCDGMSSKPTQLQQSLSDQRSVPKSQSFGFTGTKQQDEQNGLRLSLTKCTMNGSTPTNRGRRAPGADQDKSAVAQASSKHYAALTAHGKENDLRRYDGDVQERKKQQSYQSDTTKSVSSTGSDSFFTKKRTDAQLIDFHLSAVGGLRTRARRHTTTGASTQTTKISSHGNQRPVAEKVTVHKHDRLACFPPKKKAELVDFHLSRFNLTSSKVTTAAESAPDNVRVGHHESCNKEKKAAAMSGALKQPIPQHSTNELCDLAYLNKFRSLTV